MNDFVLSIGVLTSLGVATYLCFRYTIPFNKSLGHTSAGSYLQFFLLVYISFFMAIILSFENSKTLPRKVRLHGAALSMLTVFGVLFALAV